MAQIDFESGNFQGRQKQCLVALTFAQFRFTLAFLPQSDELF